MLSKDQKTFGRIVTVMAVLLFFGVYITGRGQKEEAAVNIEAPTAEETEMAERDAGLPKEPEPVTEEEREEAEDVELSDVAIVSITIDDAQTLQMLISEPLAQAYVTQDNGLFVVVRRWSVDAINIYAEPSADSKRIGELQVLGAAKALSRVEDPEGDWFLIESGDVCGYARTAYFATGIEAFKLAEQYGEIMTLEQEEMSCQLINYPAAIKVDDHIPEKTREKAPTVMVKAVAGEGNALYEVMTRVPENLASIIKTRVVSENYTVLTGVNWTKYAEADAERKALVDDALSFVGGRYVWGGNNLNIGVDCSGFVREIYARHGVILPRTAEEQAMSGTTVDITLVKPGDLVFYSKNNVIYHVAMYIGDGKIVHAKNAESGIVVGAMSGTECRAIRLLP